MESGGDTPVVSVRTKVTVASPECPRSGLEKKNHG